MLIIVYQTTALPLGYLGFDQVVPVETDYNLLEKEGSLLLTYRSRGVIILRFSIVHHTRKYKEV